MSPALTAYGNRIAIDANTGCWIWTGGQDGKGYGRIRSRKGNRFAHRATYELDRGPIPAGLVIDHLCRVTLCCNPDHLEPVTVTVNNRRGHGNSFTSDGLCMKGLHDITAPGAVLVLPNKRLCKQCKRDGDRAVYERRKARKKLLEGAPNA